MPVPRVVLMMLFDLLFIITATTWLIGLALAGRLSVQTAMVAMFALVILRAAARGLRVRVARLVFGIGVPVAGLLALMGTYGSTAQERAAIAAAVGVLVIVMFGFYLIVRGAFGR